MVVAAVMLAWMLGACAGLPADSQEAELIETGVVRTVVEGRGFHHVVFRKGTAAPIRRIYIGGDGRAHPTPDTVAIDPTPAFDLALGLFAQDPEPSAYIARPCYRGLARSSECNPRDWTLGRYSDRVVDSMAAVISSLIGPERTTITLVGFSGGGVIAVLAAERVAGKVRVVTLAAPLDVAAWTDLHGYSPLTDSLDPVALPDWRPTRHAWHLMGSQDPQVPPSSIARYRALTGPESTFSVINGYDHTCCWQSGWPGLLANSPWHIDGGQSDAQPAMLPEDGGAVRDGSRDPG